MRRIISDIVIIGAGITGTAAAIFLVKHGFDVILIDKGRIGNEASGRNGGGVRQQYRKPAERHIAMQATALWQEMQDDWGCDLEYVREGSYRLIMSNSSKDEASTRVTTEQAAGLDVVLLNPDDTREQLPIIGTDTPILGSSYCASDGTANPLLTMKHLRRLAEKCGVQIRDNEAVQSFTVVNESVQSANTSSAVYQGGIFINTAGPWTSSLVEPLGMKLPIQKKISKILVTESISPILKGFVSFKNGYMRQAADGNLHLGLKSELAANNDKSIARDDFNKVARYFLPIFPFLGELNIIRAFAGLTAWTPDELPIIDTVPGLKNIFVSAGYSAHGFCIGPLVGRLIANWISQGEKPIDLLPFALDRFEK